MKKNCWEFMKCGREPNGKKADEFGVCPACICSDFDKLNEGDNAGRSCWMKVGTFCNGDIQGDFSKKIFACLECAFFQQVMTEEGDNFTLLTKGSELQLIMNFYGKLKASNTKLEEQKAIIDNSSKLSALGQMAAGIAHEINNPLTIIAGYNEMLCEMAKRDQLSKERVIALTTNVLEIIDRITKIINGLRNFSRDAKEDNFKFESVHEIINDTISFCEEKFKKNLIDLQLSNIDKNINIYCRKIQISQVLLNLLNNSFDAIIDSENMWIRIEVEETKHNIVLRIIDSGLGIDEAIKNKILDPFYTTKEIGKGTGLGLSISNTILVDHQGSLEIDFNHANTCFLLKFPKKDRGAIK